MAELLSCVEIVPSGTARRAVIWMHGLGADGHDFEPIVPELGLDDLDIRFVFPHAPPMPVTINGGFVMPSWYDIKQMDLQREHDREGIAVSAARITQLIERENERGIACDDIVLAGFSQGGAMALHVGLRHTEPLAGIAALSTYLVNEDDLEKERLSANAGVAIFQGHGTLDPMVPIARGEAARDQLQRLGHTVEWHTYPMPHSVHPKEIQDVAVWFRKVFA